MGLQETGLLALRGLRAHRLRSVLTMLGIAIGVAAMILLVAIGNGAQAVVGANLEPLANQITIRPSSGNVPGGGAPRGFTDADIAALQKSEEAPDIATVVPAITGRALAETHTTKFRATVVGTTGGWLEVNYRDLQVGSFFDEAQVRSTARIVVLGATTAANLFGDDPAAALNRTIRLNNQIFTVVGVIQSVSGSGDSDAVIPLSTARRYILGGGADQIDLVMVNATRAAAVPAAEDQVIRILSARHRIADPAKRDFEVQSDFNLLGTVNKILRILTLFNLSVAAISLVVGGIGLLNIMLVSVTERTHEIGIRKAIGATRRAVFEQFLIESVILAAIAGLIGVLVGVGLSALGAAIAPSFAAIAPSFASFAPTVSIPSVVVSFLTSLTIGLVAGSYPANRAARLQPVDALRIR